MLSFTSTIILIFCTTISSEFGKNTESYLHVWNVQSYRVCNLILHVLGGSYDAAELFIANLAVAVLVELQDRLVDDLLELSVLQIISDHHLQHLEEFSVGNETVIVQVINPENSGLFYM